MDPLTMNQKEEAKLIKDKANWPMIYCLPVKKSKPDGGWPDFGTIMYNDQTEIILEAIDNLLPLKVDEVAKVPRKKYESVEAMVLDGWRVD